jgi:hypothetical protein
MHRHMLVLLAAPLLAACALGTEARLTIILPEPPAPWRDAFPQLGCLLTWPGGGTMELDTWASGSEIVVKKACNMPVLAYPVLHAEAAAGQILLRPAGGIYPGSVVDDSGGAELGLSWEDGAAATILADLLAAGRDTSLFNAGRLASILRQKPDPWDVDLVAASEAIARGDFSVYDIDLLPAHDVTVAAGTGTWVTESPFRPPATAGRDGLVFLSGMSEGLHELFSTDGRVVHVEVGQQDSVVVEDGRFSLRPQAAQRVRVPCEVQLRGGHGL